MSERRTFVTLDGLRGIAALAVICRHAPLFLSSVSIGVHRPDGSVILVGPFFESYLAVDFFFALSGFILAHTYQTRLWTGDLSPRRFMTIRAVRLYPLYFVSLLLSLLVFRAYKQLTGPAKPESVNLLADILCAFVFLPSPASPALLFPLNPPAWSLFNEILANAVFGVAGKRLRAGLLLSMVCVAGIVLLISVIQSWIGFGADGTGAMNDGFNWHDVGAGLARVFYSFFVGVLVFRIWDFCRPAINVPPVIIAFALGVILASNPPPAFEATFDLLTTLFVFPCLIFLGASSVPKGAMARLFTSIGIGSYGVYVLQQPLYETVVLITNKIDSAYGLNWPRPSWAAGLAFIAFTFAIALLCDRYIDRPVRAITLRAIFPSRQVTFTDKLLTRSNEP